MKFNRETTGDDRQRVERGSATMASRSATVSGPSLTEIAAAKFAAESDDN